MASVSDNHTHRNTTPDKHIHSHSHALKGVLELLKETQPEVSIKALDYLTGLTATAEGQCLLCSSPPLLQQLVVLVTVATEELVRRPACLILVNVSANENGASMLLRLHIDVTDPPALDVAMAMTRAILDPESCAAGLACMVLSNLTRSFANAEVVVRLLVDGGCCLDRLVLAFTATNYNTKGVDLEYLASVFSNLSQSATFRRYLLDREHCMIQQLMPFTDHRWSPVRRKGIVGTLRNCCFDIDSHPWLLSSEVDLLPCLLVPLAGPEEFPESDMDKFPIELQYLPNDKTREEDPDIRIMLLEALLQLCATKESRELLRNSNVYLILREFHKWESDRRVLLACENVVDILIKTEEEIGEDNLCSINVPDDLHEKFQKMDEDFVSN